MAKRGRPLSFDRDKALESALELFWAKGYEGATLEELLAAMGGLSPPSFYNAFGSKEKLFREAADLYVRTVGEPSARTIQHGDTARESIELMLRATVASVSKPGKPHGCFMVLGATNCSAAGEGAQEYLRNIRKRGPRMIKQRLDQAVAEGELAPGLDTAAIAAFYAAVVHGVGVQAGDGVGRAALMAAVDGAMAAWEPLTRTSKGITPRRGSTSATRRT
jgi:AcrR family transcriptional regulator